jgi:hypothetical protein
MIYTSPDGQWAAVRRGREVVLLAGGSGPPVGKLELDTDDADLAIIGPPSVLVAVTRGEPKIVLYQPPYLEGVARLDLETPMRLAAITGPRIALVSLDGKQVTVVRAAGRALSASSIDAGSVVEFAVGLDRNQLLLGLLRKLEVWDAVSARPLLRLQLQLPPPPRNVGAAQGHLWVTRPGSDEVFVYRLSDGRPFRHHIGEPVEDVICHPASPLIVLVTARKLVRLHCFAHSLAVVDAPWTPGMPLAELVTGDDISLIGITNGGAEPWRVSITSTPVSAPAAVDPGAAGAPRTPVGSAATEPMPVLQSTQRARTWREPLAVAGAELARGSDAELPVVPVDTELGELAHRLALATSARRALVALYSVYLVGETLSIARLAHVLGEWSEALGQGELGALAMLRRRGGRVSLRAPVSDLLDGLAPRTVRVVGGAATSPRRGAARFARAGKSDATIEAELATQLGRIAVIHGGAQSGLLEARLYGATAVALAPPASLPQPWPREAGLIVVSDGAIAPHWVNALPEL